MKMCLLCERKIETDEDMYDYVCYDCHMSLALDYEAGDTELMEDWTISDLERFPEEE